jgi:hypothetical protein
MRLTNDPGPHLLQVRSAPHREPQGASRGFRQPREVIIK